MIRRIFNILLLLNLVMAFQVSAQEEVYLVPDRTSCVSGDTVWFNTIIFNAQENFTRNVVHVQLDNLHGGHITRVSIANTGTTDNGFIVVPDSLSTGIYVLKAFTNIQKDDRSTVVRQRLISVYNRFETEIGRITFPETQGISPEELEGVEVHAGTRSAIGSRQLNFDLEIVESTRTELEQLIVIARLADPVSEAFSKQWITGKLLKETTSFMPVREQNGVLVTGKIYSKEDGSPAAGAIVLLSISDTLPYFDYCISDEQGRFYFYVRDAYGTGNLVVQELTDEKEKNEIELDENYIETGSVQFSDKILTTEERNYAEDIIKAAYFERFFRGYLALATDSFKLQKTFRSPFYGPPTRSYRPDLFIDLPDFQEISREILHGVQYRERKDGVSIRMLDEGTQTIFKEEPFKLLDGIPVFDPEMFSNLGTAEINKVDVVFFKRFFGDISFDGVMAVYTNQPSLSWIESIDGVQLFRYPCLQPKRNWGFRNKNTTEGTTPDFKKVLYREKWNNIPSKETISFDASDIKGDIVIELIGIGKNNKVMQYHQVIKLK